MPIRPEGYILVGVEYIFRIFKHLKVEYEFFSLYWSWDHFSVENNVNSLHFTEINKITVFF